MNTTCTGVNSDTQQAYNFIISEIASEYGCIHRQIRLADPAMRATRVKRSEYRYVKATNIRPNKTDREVLIIGW